MQTTCKRGPLDTMATLTIKNFPDDLYEQLRESATSNRRSIVAEATVQIERGLGRRRLTEEEVAERAHLLRENTPVYLTQQELRGFIDEGRK